MICSLISKTGNIIIGTYSEDINLDSFFKKGYILGAIGRSCEEVQLCNLLENNAKCADYLLRRKITDFYCGEGYQKLISEFPEHISKRKGLLEYVDI